METKTKQIKKAGGWDGGMRGERMITVYYTINGSTLKLVVV